jgi:hypothetical protein
MDEGVVQGASSLPSKCPRSSGKAKRWGYKEGGANTQPSRKTVDNWLSSFWKRHFVLTLLPCLVVWIWVAIPFPVSDPYKDDPFPDIPNWPKKPGEEGGMPLDVNFYFFLFWYVPSLFSGVRANDRYYGYFTVIYVEGELIFRMYLAVALFFITNLFSLYRLSKVPLTPLFHDTILIVRLVAKEIRW